MRLLYWFGMGFILFSSIILGSLFFILQQPWVDFSALENYNPGRASILLDDEGNEWARFQLDRREPVRLNKMPDHLIKAFLAAEDHDFFNHFGISFKGIIRSALVNFTKGRVVQGASTITQQLVKLLFTDSKRTFTRKIKEQFLAFLVEKQFSKEQILEIYLNHIYFGCGIYGVEAAAQRFWGKHINEISVDQSALLAGIISSPGMYCPLLHPDNSVKRRNIVLNSMKKLNFINKEEYERSKDAVINIQSKEDGPLAPYFKEYLRIILEDIVGKKALYNEGLIIQTTLNSHAQRTAQDVFNSSLEELKKSINNKLEGGLLTLEVNTGEIKAMIGGTNFAKSQFNRALQANRQIGSTFKPLIYAAAIESGAGFDQRAIDEPISIIDSIQNVWEPRNSTHTFYGPMTLALALSKSNNIIAIKTLLNVGIEKVISLAEAAGLKGKINPYPSIALGCIDATLKEVSSMFNIFANNGIYSKPYCMRWIKNRQGQKIWKFSPERKRVFPDYINSQVSKILSISLDKSRNNMAPEDRLKADAIGKTGTTNDARTCWYVGSTPDYTTALYLGCDDNQILGNNVLASRIAFPIWYKITKKLPITKEHFSYDPSLKEVYIDPINGNPISRENKNGISILIDPQVSYLRDAINPVDTMGPISSIGLMTTSKADIINQNIEV